jgi:hypothetical protein
MGLCFSDTEHTKLDISRYFNILQYDHNISKTSLDEKKVERFIQNCLIEAQRMFRDFCFLFRRLPKDIDDSVKDPLIKKEELDSDSDKGIYKKSIDPIKDEFRIYKTKELRLDEIH